MWRRSRGWLVTCDAMLQLVFLNRVLSSMREENWAYDLWDKPWWDDFPLELNFVHSGVERHGNIGCRERGCRSRRDARGDEDFDGGVVNIDLCGGKMEVNKIVWIRPRDRRKRERWKSNGSEKTRRERYIDIGAVFSHLK